MPVRKKRKTPHPLHTGLSFRKVKQIVIYYCSGYRLFLGLVFLSLLLHISVKLELVNTQPFRRFILEIGAEIGDAFFIPLQKINGFLNDASDFYHLVDENKQLRDENDRLRHEILKGVIIRRENEELRALTHFIAPPAETFITTRVVTTHMHPFRNSFLISAGKKEGIQEGQYVTDNLGIIGRVIEVYEKSARILMITDLNSHLPVFVERTGQHGLLSGQGNGRLPILEFLSDTRLPEKGDYVFTRLKNGAAETTIPVGIVSDVHDHAIFVHMYASLESLDYVRVLLSNDLTDNVQ